MYDFKPTLKYQVLTPSGWSKFKGIKKTKTDVLFTLTFHDNSEIRCTENHQIKFPNGEFLEASQVRLDDELFGGKIIKNISYELGDFEVYDLIDVELGNEYYTNDIVSHNCAFMPDAEEIWASAQMTLATGGSCCMLSTPNGAQGLFYRMWMAAEEGRATDGLEKFNTIRLPWNLHPDRDQKWRDLQEAQLGKRLADQELECSFLTSGHTVIESEILMYYHEKTTEPIEKRGIGGDLWIWKYPDPQKDYIVIQDPARGDGEDYSGLQVIDVETVEQVAEYKGKIDTQAFGRLGIAVATEYNDALLIIDNKNIGWSTVQVALDAGYKNLYYSFKNDPYLDENIHLRKNYDLKQKEDMVPGLTTTTRIRPVLISKLEIYLREKTPIIHSKRLMNELMVFMWLDGKAQAQRGYNDDLVMAFCMGLYIRDTALRMRQMGIELVKNAITHTHKTVFKPQNPGANQWQMPVGPAGQNEDLKWLINRR